MGAQSGCKGCPTKVVRKSTGDVDERDSVTIEWEKCLNEEPSVSHNLFQVFHAMSGHDCYTQKTPGRLNFDSCPYSDPAYAYSESLMLRSEGGQSQTSELTL